MATTDFRAAITADLTPSTGNKVTAAEIRSVLVEAADAIDEAEAAGGGGSGTVTSVAVSVPAGLSVSGSPVTTSGTIAITAPGNASTQYLTGAGTAALNTGLPISTATQAALDLKANAANAALTGVPTAPTAAADTSTTQIASTAFAKAEADAAQAAAVQRANHTGSQAISTVTDLQTTLDGKAASSHTHAAADIASGVIAAARLGTGASGSNYLKSDGTWDSPSGAGTTNDFDAFYYQASDIMLVPSTGDPFVVTRATPGATTAVVTVPGLNYGCGHFSSGFNYTGVPGIVAQSMPSGSAIYLDLTDPFSAACTYTANGGDVKDVDKRVIVLQNIAGVLSSPIPGIQSLIDAAEAVNNAVIHYTDYLIAATGGDYTSVSAAMEAINTAGTATATNQFRLYIEEGDYVDGGPGNNGIAMYNYINMIGLGKVRIFNVEKSIGTESTGSTFATWAIGHHKNINVIAYRTKYCVHVDAATTGNLEESSPNARLQIWENCTFQHFGGQDGYFHDIGMGMYSRQELEFINCQFLGGGNYIHGAVGAAYRDSKYNWSLRFYNCGMRLLHHQDYLEYVDNNIVIDNCTIEELIIETKTDTYDLGADDNRNLGFYPPLTRWQVSNSMIGYINEDAQTLTLRGQPLLIGGLNEVVTNSSASTISKGYAVKQVASVALPDDDANLDLIYFRQYEGWDGDGIFKGFAEEDIAADASGSVRLAKPGIHQAYFDNVGGNVVYGDPLELNAAGAVIKQSTGAVVAYAAATKTTDGLMNVIIPDSPNTVASGGAGGSYLEQTPASIQTGVVPRWNGKTTISSAANTGGQLEVGASSTTIHGGYDNNILARSTTPMISLESLAGFPFAFGVSGASCYIKTIAGNAAITDASGNWVFLGTVTADNGVFPSMPAYANDAAADADGTLVAGSLYTITGSRAVYKKP